MALPPTSPQCAHAARESSSAKRPLCTLANSQYSTKLVCGPLTLFLFFFLINNSSISFFLPLSLLRELWSWATSSLPANFSFFLHTTKMMKSSSLELFFSSSFSFASLTGGGTLAVFSDPFG
uniref:Uncharacterized protein n=1 Tax=Lutzomyia longipalpis TaxID=7200 RepID=A0A7G3B6I5_LUTLO